MSGVRKKSSKRTAVTELDVRAPKQIKIHHDKPSKIASTAISTVIPPPEPISTSSLVAGPDKAFICQLCKEKAVDKTFLDVIEHRQEWTELNSRMEHPLDSSCDTCRILLYAQECQSKFSFYDKAAYFYRWIQSGPSSDSGDTIEVFRLGDLSKSQPSFEIRKPNQRPLWLDPADLRAEKRMKADLPYIREMLRKCQHAHHDCQLASQQRVRGLKVIQCSTNMLIRAPDNCKYAALSYVWGSTIVSTDLRDPPRTIADALKVTQALGFSYLWVDRYCIDQEDAQEKHTQIRQMGSIYGQAEITIIAAAGRDPTHGLPGISTERQPVNQFPLEQYVLSSLDRTSKDMLSASTWMSRAWTYQEFILSRRRLIFTDQHIIFACQKSIVEEWPASAWKTSYDSLWATVDMGCNLDGLLSLRTRPRDLYDYTETITRYLKRNLSYSSDTLNGIMGVLSTFEAKCSIQHLYGVPYLHKGNKADLCLLWYSSAEAADYDMNFSLHFVPRRKVKYQGCTQNQLEYFPSWSWPAWEMFPRFFQSYKSVVGSSLKFSVELTNGDKLPLEEYSKRRKSGEDIITSPALWVTGFAIPVMLFTDTCYACISIRNQETKRDSGVAVEFCFNKDDLRRGNGPTENCIGLFAGGQMNNTFSVWFLLLDKNKESSSYQRIGTFCNVRDSYTPESCLSEFLAYHPNAKQQEIRLV